MNIKMRQEDYSALRAHIFNVKPPAQLAAMREEYKRSGHGETRFLWDLLWTSKYQVGPLYRYLNDSHIETALRRIAAEVKP